MSIFTIIALLVAPFVSTFYYDELIDKVSYLVIIDVIMLIDTGLNFFTGYFDTRTKTVNLDPNFVFT